MLVAVTGFVPMRVPQRARVLVRSAVEEKEEVKFDPATLPKPTADELKSETDYDFSDLAEKLAASEFEAADQITRDALIHIAGKAARDRKYVYFTEVKHIPKTDLRTLEKLWNKYSDGKFGYSVQRRIWKTTAVKGDFEKFCKKIDWNTIGDDGETERKRRWFGTSEFVYNLDAVRGHLPLTSALRGTSLIKEIFSHPLWEEEEWNQKKK